MIPLSWDWVYVRRVFGHRRQKDWIRLIHWTGIFQEAQQKTLDLMVASREEATFGPDMAVYNI